MNHFGLLGFPLSHSVSSELHQRLFKMKGHSADYTLYTVSPAELPLRAEELLSLDGFNITIPHKKAIIPYLSALSPEAETFGAVNTVYKTKGYNTDVTGFERSLRVLCGSLPGRALVVGSGGTAGMMTGFLLSRGVAVACAVRNPDSANTAAFRSLYGEKVEMLRCADVPADFPLICNATPCGMFPHTDECPLPVTAFRGVQYAFDALYNPSETAFLKHARAGGAKILSGATMLVFQAAAAQEIWLGESFADEELFPVVHEMELLTAAKFQPGERSILLSGFMGAGKTFYGKWLAAALSLPFYDADGEIEKRAGMPISDYFKTFGEVAFRELECEVILSLLTLPGRCVLSLGGGALHEKDNAAEFKKRGFLIFIDTPLSVCLSRIENDPSRPNAAGGQELYDRRLPLYVSSADYRFIP